MGGGLRSWRMRRRRRWIGNGGILLPAQTPARGLWGWTTKEDEEEEEVQEHESRGSAD